MKYQPKHAKPGASVDPKKLAAMITLATTGGIALPMVSAGTANAATSGEWNAVAQCESGGNWSINHSSDGLSVGGLQFQTASWNAALDYLASKGYDVSGWNRNLYQGMPTSQVPSKDQTILAGEALLHIQGPGAWVCKGGLEASMFDGGPNPWGLPGTQVPAGLGGTSTSTTTSSTSPAKTSSNASVSNTGVTARAQKAIDYAKSKISSAPYLWGGAGPSRFDCSGLTMRAWEAAGISLPHNAAAQYAALTHVSSKDIRPGDLVFFNYTGYIDHVGIYVGPIGPNGEDMIDTATRHPNGGVNWSTLKSRGPLAGVGRPAPNDVPQSAPVPTNKPQPASPSGWNHIHTVKPGDTLYGIAKTHGVGSWQELYAHNKDVVGPNPNLIFPGERLRTP